jgi:hypothetical protein
MILVSMFTLTNWNLDKGLKKDQLSKYMQYMKEGGLWNRFMPRNAKKEEVYLINQIVGMRPLNLFWGVQNLSKLIAFKRCNR